MRPGLHKNHHTGCTTYDTHTRSQSNGGRSLKPEHLALHQQATIVYHLQVYGEILESTNHQQLQE